MLDRREMMKRAGMAARKDLRKPLWLGEAPLAGKTILLHAEQGLGDTLLFAVGLFVACGDRYNEAASLLNLGDTRQYLTSPPIRRERRYGGFKALSPRHNVVLDG